MEAVLLSRWVAAALSLALLLGALALSLGLYARSCLNPRRVRWSGNEFVITAHDRGETRTFEIARRGSSQVALSLSGSTDLCDPPFLMLLDIDGDSIRDLYFQRCNGHGFVRYRPDSGMLDYVEMGQPGPVTVPRAYGFWGRQIHRGGWELIAWGGALGAGAALGLLGLALSLAIRR